MEAKRKPKRGNGSTKYPKGSQKVQKGANGSKKSAKMEPEGAKWSQMGTKRAPGWIYLCFTRFKGDRGPLADFAAAPIVNLPVREVDF